MLWLFGMDIGALMQCLARDVYRLAYLLDFFRLMSFFYSNIHRKTLRLIAYLYWFGSS
jgi:hypothetical protein